MSSEEIKIFIQRLHQWYHMPDIPERGIECFLWIELFRNTLKYPPKYISVQHQLEDNGSNEKKHKPDIILSSSNIISYPIEIKKPNIGIAAFRTGRHQVANYAKMLNLSYAIITDGLRWDILSIHPKYNQYKHIWSHRIEKDSDLSVQFIKCLRPKMIQRFLLFAEQMFGNIGYEKLHSYRSRASMSNNTSLLKLLRENTSVSIPLVKLLGKQMDLCSLNKAEKPKKEWIKIDG